MAEFIDDEKNVSEESSGIDFRMLWSIVVLNWYWLILSTVVCLGVAYFYLRYQPAVYQASTKVLIKDDNSKMRGADMTLDQLGFVSNSNGFENEIEIISSTSVATRAVKKMKIYVNYVVEGRLAESDLYKATPIIVEMEDSLLDKLVSPIFMEITKDEGAGYQVLLNPGDNETVHAIKQLPAVIDTPYGPISFRKNGTIGFSGRRLLVTIYSPIMMGRMMAGRLNVSPTSKMTTVANLSIVDVNTQRATDYLTELVKAYNEDANEDKNEVAEKTRQFIDERIQIIQGELDDAEGRIEDFKTDNRLVNLPSDATVAVSQSNTFQQQLVDIQTQMSLVQALLDYVKNPSNCFNIIPANIGINNAASNSMVDQYNTLVLKRNRLILSSSENSPAVAQFTLEAQAMWDAIGQHLRNIYKEMTVQKNSIEKQYNLFAGKVSSTPVQERAMNDMGRQQQIKVQLYLMLAERREENYISLASTANKARIIDMPQLNGKVSPKDRMIMLGALIFGLFLPLGLFYLRELLHFHIEGRGDLEKATKIPIVADIPLANKIQEGQRAVVVKENKNNMMEESFRGLRTNLRFLLGPDEKVICCTSCVPGEGKTFVATNLAMSLALLGKRVLIVGLDIRKPRLVNLFGLPSSKHGITTYLAGDKADFQLLEAQITKGVLNPNLDVLPAGIIPPNPGELITRELLDQGIDYLKGIYDYIILDTPPIGLVSDTFELARLSNITFFVVRSEVSTKSDIDLINRTANEGKLPKINIVFNGLNLKKKKYGFYYGYGRYSSYSKYGTYYGRYGHYGTYGNYGDRASREHVEK